MRNKSVLYFLSDAHLGIPNHQKSLEREKLLVRFLNNAGKDATEIFLLGDIFDFWFEYKSVVPKGFVRLFGTIASLTDSGIPVHYFRGNHDMWIFKYFTEELGVVLHKGPIEKQVDNKLFYIGHGDGLGPGDLGYKFLKKVFLNPLSRFMFAALHPGIGTSTALYFSKKSRLANATKDEKFVAKENERLVVYCHEMLKIKPYNYFIFGHRHIPMDVEIGSQARYINTGDWFKNFSYVHYDGTDLQLKYYR